MKRRIPFVLLFALGAASQDPAGDEAAKAALRKLADRFKEVRTLSAKVVQTRRTELMDKPIVSSGSMYYRREPARLMFRMTEPTPTEIHMDRRSYQVYRPDEKRLEQTDFESDDVSGRILMMFEPKPDEIGKGFAIRGGESKNGVIEVRLEAGDEKIKARLRKIVLGLTEGGAMLKRIGYTDADGDDVQFELSDVALNPDLSPDHFTLRVPDGTKVFRHALKQNK